MFDKADLIKYRLEKVYKPSEGSKPSEGFLVSCYFEISKDEIESLIEKSKLFISEIRELVKTL